MSRFISRYFLLGGLCVLIGALAVAGDTLKMKDGTSLEGRVIDQGTSYWVKDQNGETHQIAKADVTSWIKGTTPDAPAPSPQPAGQPAAPALAVAGSQSFATVKAKANNCETAVAAVAIWQAYIDSKPNATDLEAAKAEYKRWQTLADGNAEKINGKWVGGDDLKKLYEQVGKLMEEGNEAIEGHQTLVAITKFEEAVKLYPNNFDANFFLGYINLIKGIDNGKNLAKIDAGIKSLELATKLKPDSAAALSDLAIGYNLREKYKLAVMTAYKAVKLEDSKGIVQNLVTALAAAPEGMRKNDPAIKPIVEETLILAAKYNISASEVGWVWVRPEQTPAETPDEKHAGKQPAGKHPGPDEPDPKGPPGIFANGSGFFISPDGYIMTNRHVAKTGDYLIVRLSDGTERLAKRIVIDDEQDLAVIKINTTDPVPFIHLAPYDHPPTGAEVAVFGFPLLSEFGLGSSVKMTRGIVTAWDKNQEFCDVTVDAQVNPGNSGGPMVDKHGNLLAITAMKTLSAENISSYGLGISATRIRKFIEKQKAKLSPLTLEPGVDTGFAMNTEQLATKLTPATVCILMCRGTPPNVGAGK